MERRDIVQAYLQILDMQDRELDFAFLNDILTRHVATFAFSSVGCQLGDDLPLKFKSLYQRIVMDRRGGYCFEHNGFLFEVLEELGFSPTLYLARVIHNKDIYPGLTHRITMIEYDGQQYVLDAGFGLQGPRKPVSMSGAEQHDSLNTFRIFEKRTGEYHMQILKDGAFYSLYRFELVLYGEADCELGHFFSHRHPDANFVNHLVISLLLESETRALVDLKYSVTTASGNHRQDVVDSEQLKQIIVDELGVHISADESRQLYEKLAAKGH